MSKKRLTKMNTEELAKATSEFDQEFAADNFGEPDEAAWGKLDRANMLDRNPALEAQMGSEDRTIDISGLMEALSRQRPIFHSEADLQHEFAWLLRTRTPEAAIRLERPIEVHGQRIHLDLLVHHADRRIAIELKYKTRALTTNIGAESFDLASHSAQDLGRYDFLADVERIEDLSSASNITMGYAILLTNDSAYWKLPRKDDTVDASFRIHEGRSLKGSRAWTDAASPGTTKSREKPIMLSDPYVMRWRDYSRPCVDPYGQFRWLLVEIGPNGQTVAK